jgi:hypothetical protein
LPAGWRALAGAANSTLGSVAVAVYGDSSHPWSGPLLVVTAMDDTGAVDFTADGEISIEGANQAWIRHADDGWHVTRLDDDRYVFVEGRGMERDEVVTAARSATGEPAIAQAGLPDRFEELARGDWTSSTWPHPVTPDAPPGGYAIVYGDGESTISLVQSVAPASAVALLRLDHPTVATTLRGQPALLARGSNRDDVLLQWYEPPGLVVTVATSGGTGEELARRFAESLHSTSATDVERLVSDLPRENLPHLGGG